MEKQTVKAIEHTDIRGKKQKYLVIGEGLDTQVVINVGDKTYAAVKRLTEPENKKEVKK